MTVDTRAPAPGRLSPGRALAVKLAGSFLGVGFLPWAPGTWGSLAAFGIWLWLCLRLEDHKTVNLVCVLLAVCFSLAVLGLGNFAERVAGAALPGAGEADRVEPPPGAEAPAPDRMGPFKRALSAARRLPLAGFRPPGTDPGWFVLDELAGAFLALYGLAPYNRVGDWVWAGAAFLLFRVLDATKLGAIGWADRRLKGAVGILLDDLFAGAAANLIVRGAHWLVTGSG